MEQLNEEQKKNVYYFAFLVNNGMQIGTILIQREERYRKGRSTWKSMFLGFTEAFHIQTIEQWM